MQHCQGLDRTQPVGRSPEFIRSGRKAGLSRGWAMPTMRRCRRSRRRLDRHGLLRGEQHQAGHRGDAESDRGLDAGARLPAERGGSRPGQSTDADPGPRLPDAGPPAGWIRDGVHDRGGPDGQRVRLPPDDVAGGERRPRADRAGGAAAGRRGDLDGGPARRPPGGGPAGHRDAVRADRTDRGPVGQPARRHRLRAVHATRPSSTCTTSGTATSCSSPAPRTGRATTTTARTCAPSAPSAT